METTYFFSLAGGVLIGLSASLLLLLNGRIAGISGILGTLLSPKAGDVAWRVAFLAGLVVTGAIAWLFDPGAFANTIDRPLSLFVLAGLLVGFGTRLGNGCTSGHGVCGLSRLSVRSLIATVTFIGTGAATVFVIEHLMGGS